MKIFAIKNRKIADKLNSSPPNRYHNQLTNDIWRLCNLHRTGKYWTQPRLCLTSISRQLQPQQVTNKLYDHYESEGGGYDWLI